jgi:SAM-dependent methyltransferase
MSKIYTTEITSDTLASDNPIHQRLLKAYVLAHPYVYGDVLEIGCGEGRGIDRVITAAGSYTAIDKIEPVIEALKKRFPEGKFFAGNIPPLTGFRDAAYDVILSFQVIEHIQKDRLFLEEINRLLKPGGKALITTPNRSRSLTRNPWHIREYTGPELQALAKTIFRRADVKGITGSPKVEEYYERNRKSVERVARFDIFDLQHRLPAAVLRAPYEWLNRWNRNKLHHSGDELAASIGHEDYILTDDPTDALDLLLIVEK